MAKLFLITGSVNAALCIVLGAFASHKLKSILNESALSTFQTGVQYHFYHSLALILLALLLIQLNIEHALFRYAGYGFLAGMLLFSGSLYGLSFELGKWLGPLTPLGGLCFIAAWLLFAYAAFKHL